MTALRFCFVTTFYPPHNFGGDGIGVQRWARALVRRGHEVTVVYDSDCYDTMSPLPAAAPDESDGVHVRRVRSLFGPASLLLTHQLGRPVLNARALRRALGQNEFDVIHYHNISMVGGPGVLGVGSALKLYTAWEHWLVCPTHVLWRHGRERCSGRECVRCTVRYHRPPQLWRYGEFFKRQLRHVNGFIALSEFSRRMHREFGFEPAMDVIPGFLPDDDGVQSPATSPSPHPRPYFFFAGRLEVIKGLDDIVPAFRDYPDADLLIAGDGEHRHELERLAAGSPRIKFLGRLPSEALEQYYAHAVATIVPSVGYETFGFVVIEAFRRGSPVLARRVGPLPELVDQCGGGATFETAAELLVSLRRMQYDPAWRDTLARCARRGFEERWSESAVVPRYFELIERLSSGTPARDRALAASAAS
jgi:glycosyltransferase involved in cell wall biosynthesis